MMARVCAECGAGVTLPNAEFCARCGKPLPEEPTQDPSASTISDKAQPETRCAAEKPLTVPSGHAEEQIAAPPVPAVPVNPCPYCGFMVEVPWPERCPNCDRLLETRPLDSLPRVPWSLRITDRMAFGLSVLLSAVLVGTLLRTVDDIVARESLIRQILLPEGMLRLIPEAITVLFVWSILQVLWRSIMLITQHRYPSGQVRQDWLQTLRSGRLPGDPEVIRQLGGEQAQRSWWVSRLRRSLTHWLRTRDPSQVNAVLEQHAVLDSEAVRSNYSLVRLAIWAMPILGFIGTVIGITLAIQDFSQFLGGEVDDIDRVRTQLMQVTEGLSYAFLTTMYGLVTALIAMFVTSFAEKGEQDLLVAADRYALDQLVPALQSGSAPATQRGITDVKQRPETGPEQLSEQVDVLSDQVGDPKKELERPPRRGKKKRSQKPE